MNPKLHLFQHLTEWQCVQYDSAQLYSTYVDEGMVGHLIEYVAICHPTALAVTAPLQVASCSCGESDWFGVLCQRFHFALRVETIAFVLLFCMASRTIAQTDGPFFANAFSYK